MVGARPAHPTIHKEAGKKLRVARQKRGVGIEEAASELRIPPNQLAALEEGELDVFPAEIYAWGAYQKYANYLGICDREQHHEFLRSLTEVRQSVPLKLPVSATWLQRALTPYGVIGAGVALAVLGVAGYLGWEVKWYMHLPDLRLIEPAAALTNESLLKVRGVSEKEAEVTINGEAVTLDENSQFQREMSLREGINVIQVEAKGVSGRTRKVTRDVLRVKPGN